MKDRTKKSKSPWMKDFVIDSTKKDDLAKSRADALEQISSNNTRKRITKLVR